MMWTFGLASVVAAALLAEPARAAPVDEIIGNTILSTYPDGRTGELWLQADGSYAGEGRRGEPSSGHWSVSGGKLCLRQSKPMPSILSFCAGAPVNGLRDGWTRKAITGETIRVRLVHGRVRGNPVASLSAMACWNHLGNGENADRCGDTASRPDRR